MNERVKKLSEEIRKLSPEEQADLMDELLVLTYREPDPRSRRHWARERSSVGIGEPTSAAKTKLVDAARGCDGSNCDAR